ncbi:phosphate signaling complex protein PhoU [Helicobacter anatolicus]|uniref:phosphate signaling complex protein PhoU n=1 Tax=Helicobacter anatolicus TaxID=2905874 RepID=UPI001E45C930|nr:phosphate signaling complex protein PhoU [Helicobacter anatolicus]MCE3037974.1 phosphate signaling complex protein PhoU [Helicobacter anatolicus]MCE3040310.1 phosphate signaling complex protein PhoU [Helicobacter anatolicus]
MRTLFNHQLETLNTELIKMGGLCEEIILLAIQALNHFQDHYQEAYKLETLIDSQERNIQDLCMQILLQQQPIATDLRKVYSALKIISDMERIGDMSLDITKIAKTLPVNSNLDIKNLANGIIDMVTKSIDCFVKQDLKIVQEVILQDDIIDKEFYAFKQKIITKLTMHAEKSEEYIDYLMIAKYFEKIGDHATNIAEWVYYSITGNDQNDLYS